MNFKDIEIKWQKAWDDAKIFESLPDRKRKKFFVTFPYPYVNGGPHIGHCFSFFRVDCYARFKRMNDFNVLYPQGFHATGEPILGTVERLKKDDPVQIDTFKLYGATENQIDAFKKGPEHVARFWMKKWVNDFKLSGCSIDWSRMFVTAITPTYNRFIEWQYNKLKNNNYIVQGTHPVVWCPHDQSPTGDHDRLKGEGESPVEYTMIKFVFEDEDGHRFIFPCATLRPETIYGVTNIWLKPGIEYSIAMINNENWVVSKKAIEKLSNQLFNVNELGVVSSDFFFGKRCKNPVTNKEIPILPFDHVDTDIATGVVMSVPAHAPHDWFGIKELLKDNEKKRLYNISSDELKPIPVIFTEEFGEFPAIELMERMKNLDDATSLIYKKEFHSGVLRNNCGIYAGKKISDVKDHLMIVFKNNGVSDSIWETTDIVVCRCSNKCHVKILENQWFLNYSNERWKESVRRHLATMRLYPEISREQFENTIEWLRDKACARKSGLGTKLPWDKAWIVETLSDSTVYMAYYTIARVINQNDITAETLTDDVFDFIFLGKGDIKIISKSSGMKPELLKDMRENFEYFYPVDFRGSGKDLMQHHLIFYIFHHVALFPEKCWPRSIGVNGYVNVGGEKMSKSKGNIIPLHELIERHGADLVRLNMVTSAESLDDADWREENIPSLRNRLLFLDNLIERIDTFQGKDKLDHIDEWLDVQLNKIIKESTIAYDETRFRTAVNLTLFKAINDMKWYLKRTEIPNKRLLVIFITDIIKMLAPITPHFCEELWKKLGHSSFISLEKWPDYNDIAIMKGGQIERDETLIRKTIDDVEHIKRMVKKQKPSKIILFVAKTEKFSSEEDKNYQINLLESSSNFFSKEFGCDVEILNSDFITDRHDHAYQKKSQNAAPDKFGIMLF